MRFHPGLCLNLGKGRSQRKTQDYVGKIDGLVSFIVGRRTPFTIGCVCRRCMAEGEGQVDCGFTPDFASILVRDAFCLFASILVRETLNPTKKLSTFAEHY